MFVEKRASVEAVLDERDPSKLRIDIRVHPIGSGSLGSEAGEIQRAICEGFRDALRETQLKRLMVAPNPRPKRRGWSASVLGFFLCVGLGSAATFLLTATDPRPTRRRRDRGSWERRREPWVAIGAAPRAVRPASRPALPASIACRRRGGRERAGSRGFGLHQQ